MKVIEKAFRVWVYSMIGEYPTFSPNDLDVVYATSASKAKNSIWIGDEKNEDGEKATWIDIKCKRVKSMDKIEHNGVIMTRQAYYELMDKEKRNDMLRSLDENDMYYVQDSRSYVGNSVLWWANGGGYTTDIKKAERYTKWGILNTFLNGRDSDIIWSSKHVDTKVKAHIDVQYLEKEFCV